MNGPLIAEFAEIIRTFPWHNFGLDEVGDIPAENADYARALAERIAASAGMDEFYRAAYNTGHGHGKASS